MEEQTEYFIFSSKLLKFEIITKIDAEASQQADKLNFEVTRFETDFYVLRNILVLSFGQCLVPPLTPTTKETVFDKKSLALRERSFSRFLRGVIRCPELLNHDLVIEYLTKQQTTDKDLKEFSKKLLTREN